MFNLGTSEGRKASAFAALLGACIIFTIFAAVGVYLVSGIAKYSYYLALAAHAQIMIGLTAFTALFVRRTIKIGRDGVDFSNAADSAEKVADAAVEKAEEIKEEINNV